MPIPISVNALQQFGAMPGDDPLGTALRDRARNSTELGRRAQMAQDTSSGDQLAQAVHTGGPLPDPDWQAFYQALQERAPGGIRAKGGADPMTGLPTAPIGTPSTMFAPGQTSAVTGQAFSPALTALKRQASLRTTNPPPAPAGGPTGQA